MLDGDIIERDKEGSLNDADGTGNARNGPGTSYSCEAARLWRQNVVLRLTLLQASLQSLENEVHKIEQSRARGVGEHLHALDHRGTVELTDHQHTDTARKE